MKLYWSDDLRIMFRPTATYLQLARQADDGGLWLLLRRPLFVALVFGAFSSFTISGRLTIPFLFDGALFWSFVPVLQALLMASIVLVFARGRMPMPKAINLFFIGHCPWLLWMLGVAGICLFLPFRHLHLRLAEWGWLLPISLLGAWAWSHVISFGFLRGALKMSALGAGVALLLYTVILWGAIISYLFIVESFQLHRLGF